MQRTPRRSASSYAARTRRAAGGQVRPRTAPQQGRPRPHAAVPPAQPPRPDRPRPPQNPQKPGYRPGAAVRRVTRAQLQRQRRRRALLGLLLVVLVLALGIFLSINLLFKVTAYRVTDLDGSAPADTGIYSEEQILDVLAVPTGANLFGFSTAAKAREMAAQLPYLEEIEVAVSLPGTVVVRVSPAQERFAVELPAGWLILSDGLKVLRTAEEATEGTIRLQAALPPDVPTLPGQFLTLESHDSLLEAAPATAETALPAQPSASPAAESADAGQTLAQLMAALDRWGLLEGVTALNMTDLSNLTFVYQDRVTVLLGSINGLEDKLEIVSHSLLDVTGQGLGAADRGTFDISYARSDGSYWGYFLPYEEPAPTPEPEGDEAGESGEDGDAGESAE